MRNLEEEGGRIRDRAKLSGAALVGALARTVLDHGIFRSGRGIGGRGVMEFSPAVDVMWHGSHEDRLRKDWVD